jgi:hypothetical protein
MAASGKERRDAIQAALNELRAFGYCEYRRENGAQGKLSTAIIFYEQPKPDFQASVKDSTETGFAGAGQTGAGKTDAGNAGFFQTTMEKRLSETNDSHTLESVLALWANLCPNLPKPGELTPARRDAITCRLNEANGDPEVFRHVFTRVGSSSFLNGAGQNGWKASFDWVLKPESWTKILEGNFSDRRSAAGRKLTAEDYAGGF